MKKYLQWKKIHCGKSTLSCLSAFLNVHKEFELGVRGRSNGYKTPIAACQQHVREKRQKETPVASSSPVQCPVSTPSLKMLRSIWSLSFKVSACQRPATDTRPENPQHYIWSLIKIVNEFFARSDVKQEMYQIRIICLFVVTEGAILISPTQHPTQVMIVCEADL